MEDGKNQTRIALLDEIRGFCVFAMIIYHGVIVFGTFFGLGWANYLLAGLTPLEPPFAAMFILICGISSKLSRSNVKRGLKLVGLALAFSLLTVGLFPKIGITGAEDRFGILHLLGLCILLFALLEKPLSKLSPPVGVTVFSLLYLLCYGIPAGFLGLPGPLSLSLPASLYEGNGLFWLGFMNPDTFYSADYFPLLPNLFLFLAGTYLGIYAKDGLFPTWMYPKRVAPLDWLGTHALLLYLLHVPVLYGLAYLICNLL